MGDMRIVTANYDRRRGEIFCHDREAKYAMIDHIRSSRATATRAARPGCVAIHCWLSPRFLIREAVRVDNHQIPPLVRLESVVSPVRAAP